MTEPDSHDAASDDSVASRSRLARIDAPDWQRAKTLIKPVLVIVVSLVAGWIIVGFVGAVDWGRVADAIRSLAPWQVLPLVAALLARQVLNAIPLWQFVPGLTLGRSVQNDLGANLAGTVAPPPGDVVVRVAMFTSWGVNPLDGMAGVTLNMITFYSVRLLAPVIGLSLLAIAGAERGNVALAGVLAFLAIALLASLLLMLRAEAWPALLGRAAARVARRFRAGVDPHRWADAVVNFRGRMTQDLPPRLARALVALLGMVIADAAILTLALRFTGASAEVLPVLVVVGTFLTAYPLTVMPLAGLGVLDASLLAGLTDTAGLDFEPAILAALTIWRVTTILGSLALGAVVSIVWKRTTMQSAVVAATIGQEPPPTGDGA
ncbi:MAG TPA: lysylphosphatidylglycerol synthase domain-containing protein [Dermatophilaceae bacterium]|nr:lysylphosphatidylglycerol synthase domain-containing protein [Dermatophilaceae bacterium]